MRLETSDESDELPEEDPPPEYCSYPDEGCELAPACLDCHLPLCVHDNPALMRRYLRDERDREMAEKRRAGVFVTDLARQYGMSRGAASRAIARYEKRHAAEEKNERYG